MSLTVEQIRKAVSQTQEARERVRRHRSTDAVIAALAQAAKNWLGPNSPWRKRAVERAPAATGFSEAMVSEAVDLTFGAITHESLGELRERELGNQHTGPRLIVHFLAGNVPTPGIASICRGLLLRSANLVKVSSRDPVFPALFVESLREVDEELADCVAVLDWRRDEVALTRAALEGADAVIAYGDDETISALRELVPTTAKCFGYGHGISFAVVAKEAMTEENLPQLVQAAAFDASVYDQQGCMSPHVFYVEEGGQLGPRNFAAALAEAMAAYQARVPRGKLSVEEAAQIAKLRGAYEFRAASDKSVGIWASEAGNNWLVIYEDEPMFTPSCLNRVVFVKPIERLESVLPLVRRFASNLSTVGVTPIDKRAAAFTAELARMGVRRVCPIGQMQRPPLSAHYVGG
jgi:acyl-CoA reductase-like NAD-dependent aldehyde dehydrogenase